MNDKIVINPFKKRAIIKYAIAQGKDVDGDIVYYNKKKYFIHILKNCVIKIVDDIEEK